MKSDRRRFVDPEDEERAGLLMLLRRVLEVAQECPPLAGGVSVDCIERGLGMPRHQWKRHLPPSSTIRFPGGKARVYTPDDLGAVEVQVEALELHLFGRQREKSKAEPGAISPTEIRAHLSTLGWSQGQYARAIGVRLGTVSCWVRGVRPIPGWAASHLKWFVSQL